MGRVFTMKTWGFAVVALALMLLTPLAHAQPALNCGAGTMPPFTNIFGQYSSWQDFSDSLALLVCNYEVGSEGGGIIGGFAINVEWRCPSETTDTWEGITFDHGDEEVGRGDNFLRLFRAGSFTSFAGQFSGRERYWWLYDNQTIIKVIMFSNGSLSVDDVLETLAGPLADAHRPAARVCSQPTSNHDPVINSLTASDSNPAVGDEITVSVSASDQDNDNLFYKWWLNGSLTSASTPSVTFTPPEAGSYVLKVEVSDGNGGTDTEEITIQTEECPASSAALPHQRPQQGSCPGSFSVFIERINMKPEPGDRLTFTAIVSGAQDVNQLSYEWRFNGNVIAGNVRAMGWTAEEGDWTIGVKVTEGNREATASISFSVTKMNVTVSQSPANPKAGDTITFTANVTGGVGDFSYEWTADGNTTSATASSILWENASAGGHSVSVEVTDSDGRTAKSGLDFFVASEDTQTTGNQLLVNGQPLTPGEPKTVTLNEDEQIELKLACENLESTIFLGVLRYTLGAREDDHRTQLGTAAIFDIMMAAGPDTLRALAICNARGLLGAFSGRTLEADLRLEPQQQNGTTLPLEIGLRQGGVQFDLQQNGIELAVHTNTTVVSASDTDTFEVIHDPTSNQSLVVAGQGTISVQPRVDRAPAVRLDAGHQVTVNAQGSGPVTVADRPITTQPPSGDLSIPEALDANNNGVLDEAEVRAAIQMWILGQEVPGTGETINDATMRGLIQMWILGTPTTQNARAAKVFSRELRVRGISLHSPDALRRSLVVSGDHISAVGVRVFGLNGQPLVHALGNGPQATVVLQTEFGQPLANGVYLYVVEVHGSNGTLWRSHVRKMVVLR